MGYELVYRACPDWSRNCEINLHLSYSDAGKIENIRENKGMLVDSKADSMLNLQCYEKIVRFPADLDLEVN